MEILLHWMWFLKYSHYHVKQNILIASVGNATIQIWVFTSHPLLPFLLNFLSKYTYQVLVWQYMNIRFVSYTFDVYVHSQTLISWYFLAWKFLMQVWCGSVTQAKLPGAPVLCVLDLRENILSREKLREHFIYICSYYFKVNSHL